MHSLPAFFVVLIVIVFSSAVVESSPESVITAVGTEILITAYDLQLNKIAEYHENIMLGPSYENVLENAPSIYENPKLAFISKSPFNIINKEKIIFESIKSNNFSSITLDRFLSGFNEVNNMEDFSLNNIPTRDEVDGSPFFDGLMDGKFIWLDQVKIWKEIDGEANGLEEFKMRVNYSLEVFDVASNIVTSFAINWSNFPARDFVDEKEATEYNFDLNWRGSAIRDKFQYQVFYYQQYPQDDQSKAPRFSKIFVIRFDSDAYTFDYYVFDYIESVEPSTCCNVVFSTDGTKIFLGPSIDGTIFLEGEPITTEFSEDQVGILVDLEQNTTTPYTLFHENDNSQIRISYVTLSENSVIYVKNERDLISYNFADEASTVLVNDMDSIIGTENAGVIGRNLQSERETVYLINKHFIVMKAGTIIHVRSIVGQTTTTPISIPISMTLIVIVRILSIRRKLDK